MPRFVPRPDIRPRQRWYWIALGIAVGSIAAAIVIGVFAVRSLLNKIDDFDRISAPGVETIELAEGSYTIYHEYSGADDDDDRFLFDPELPSVTIVGADGDAVEVNVYLSRLTYGLGDHEGVAIRTFRAPQDGSYEVHIDGGGGSVVAIGPSIGSGLVGAIIVALLVGFLGVLLAVVIVIVTYVRRGRANRRALIVAQWPSNPPY